MADCLTHCGIFRYSCSSSCCRKTNRLHKRCEEAWHEDFTPDVGDFALIKFHCMRLALSCRSNIDDSLNSLSILYFDDFHVGFLLAIDHIFMDLLGFIIEVLCTTAKVLCTTDLLSATATHSAFEREVLWAPASHRCPPPASHRCKSTPTMDATSPVLAEPVHNWHRGADGNSSLRITPRITPRTISNCS